MWFVQGKPKKRRAQGRGRRPWAPAQPLGVTSGDWPRAPRAMSVPLWCRPAQVGARALPSPWFHKPLLGWDRVGLNRHFIFHTDFIIIKILKDKRMSPAMMLNSDVTPSGPCILNKLLAKVG